MTSVPANPQRPRVVLDTNTVLDWIVFGDAPAVRIGTAITQRTVDWLASARMLDELRAVLSRPLPPRWEPARARARTLDMSPMVLLCAEPQPGPGHVLLCRDPDDQVFIDLAVQHRPALLLTRDRALLDLRRRAAAHGVTVTTSAAWDARDVLGLAIPDATATPP